MGSRSLGLVAILLSCFSACRADSKAHADNHPAPDSGEIAPRRAILDAERATAELEVDVIVTARDRGPEAALARIEDRRASISTALSRAFEAASASQAREIAELDSARAISIDEVCRLSECLETGKPISAARAATYQRLCEEYRSLLRPKAR